MSAAANVIGFSEMCDLIAKHACQKYARTYSREFLLSDDCVSGEIFDHVKAYQWAIGEAKLPSKIVLASAVIGLRDNYGGGEYYSRASIYAACASIDMREADIVPGGLQTFAFGYKSGIRKCYIGTEFDPFQDDRRIRCIIIF